MNEIAELLADRTRGRILVTLMDGRARSASLLAAEAGVAPSTASEHLRKLTDAGLVTVQAQGRHRYFRLRDAEVAAVIESMSRLAPPPEPRSLKQSNRIAVLRAGRTCYDHLAGRLGVALFDAVVGARGQELLDELRIDGPREVTSCLDWTERRHHLSGALGRELATRLFELAWIERNDVARAVTVTAAGRRGLRALQIDDRRAVDRLQSANP